MNQILIPDIKTRFLWWILEVLSKLGFGWIRKKINNWENKRLQSGLYIMDKPEVIVDGLLDKNPHLMITLVFWSSVPSILHPNRIIGSIEAKGFESEIRWDEKGEIIYEHSISDIKPNKNSWLFHVPTSMNILKNNVSSFWNINFIVVFQHDLSKAFQNIKIKIRDSDVQRINES